MRNIPQSFSLFEAFLFADRQHYLLATHYSSQIIPYKYYTACTFQFILIFDNNRLLLVWERHAKIGKMSVLITKITTSTQTPNCTLNL